jgi:hypothetical protein
MNEREIFKNEAGRLRAKDECQRRGSHEGGNIISNYQPGMQKATFRCQRCNTLYSRELEPHEIRTYNDLWNLI